MIKKKFRSYICAIIGSADSGLIFRTNFSENNVKTKENCYISVCECIDITKNKNWKVTFSRFKNCIRYQHLFDIHFWVIIIIVKIKS